MKALAYTPGAPPPFDGAALAVQTFLNSDEAAWYCGFRAPKYTKPTHAFRCWAKRFDRKTLPRYYVGRTLRFRRIYLDKAMSLGVEKGA